MSELLPCPFCGGEAEIKHVTQLWEPRNSYWAQCYNCLMSGKHFTTEAEAIETWNTRSAGTCHLFRRAAYGTVDGVELALSPADNVRGFLRERWKGLRPALWGVQAREMELGRAVYACVLNLDGGRDA